MCGVGARVKVPARNRPTRALSVRQPYVELILRGQKRFEIRSRPTKIFERVYIYASQLSADDPAAWRRVRCERGDLPVGKVVGTVEVVGCRRRGRWYDWLLANPKRLARPRTVRVKPQPVWFRPFP